MKQGLQLLFAKDGKGKKRQWIMENMADHLSDFRKQQISLGCVRFEQISQPTNNRREIPNLVGIKK